MQVTTAYVYIPTGQGLLPASQPATSFLPTCIDRAGEPLHAQETGFQKSRLLEFVGEAFSH